MLSVKNKIALVTGASSGIGKATAIQLAQQGTNLILAARRIERLEQLAIELKDKYKIKVLSIRLDVTKQPMVQECISSLPDEWKNIDILVNNAGLAQGSERIQEGKVANWDTMINTNIQGLLYVTHAVLPVMLERKQGHIINIGSTAAHDHYLTGNVYCATKHAVRALSKSMRIDLLGTGIRLTEIDPGLVHTEFSEVRWQDKQRADKFYQGYQPLVADDIADAIVYAVTRPAHVNVAEIVIYPMAQASANHLHKEDGSNKIFN